MDVQPHALESTVTPIKTSARGPAVLKSFLLPLPQSPFFTSSSFNCGTNSLQTSLLTFSKAELTRHKLLLLIFPICCFCKVTESTNKGKTFSPGLSTCGIQCPTFQEALTLPVILTTGLLALLILASKKYRKPLRSARFVFLFFLFLTRFY